MSNKLFPAPLGTPVVETSGQLTLSWQKHLKAIGDDVTAASKTTTGSVAAFKYTINGAICFWTYYAPIPDAAAVPVTLPFTALLAFDVGATVNAPGTKAITIPAGTTLLRGWYVVDFSKN